MTSLLISAASTWVCFTQNQLIPGAELRLEIRVADNTLSHISLLRKLSLHPYKKNQTDLACHGHRYAKHNLARYCSICSISV